MTYFGLAVGPIFGGWLAQAAGWPAIFWMAVPISFGGAVMAVAVVPTVQPNRGRSFDLVGTATFMAAMIAVTVLMNPSAYRTHPWTAITVLLVVAGVAAPWFVRRQHAVTDPLIDLGLFRARNYLFGTVGAIVN